MPLMKRKIRLVLGLVKVCLWSAFCYISAISNFALMSVAHKGFLFSYKVIAFHVEKSLIKSSFFHFCLVQVSDLLYSMSSLFDLIQGNEILLKANWSLVVRIDCLSHMTRLKHFWFKSSSFKISKLLFNRLFRLILIGKLHWSFLWVVSACT